MEIGYKIHKAREDKGLSREHLASILGMDVPTYEKIENNHRDISLKEVEKIAGALGTTSQVLIIRRVAAGL